MHVVIWSDGRPWQQHWSSFSGDRAVEEPWRGGGVIGVVIADVDGEGDVLTVLW